MAFARPTGVDYGLSSDTLFTDLDRNFAPSFRLITEIDPGCDIAFGGPESAAGGIDAGAAAEDDGGPNVQVLSREAVGPYDLVVLLPETVQDLRAWLDENEFQIPEAADATLAPYVSMDAAFLALKLLPASDSGDVQPIRLSFSGDTPAIPIVPTSVAADPDMGILVHLLGEARAVPANYRHVLVNEAAIDWANQGQNYADVVSQAVDEAGGQAFVTDFAGPHNDRVFLETYNENQLNALRNYETSLDLLSYLSFGFARPNDTDMQRVIRSAVSVGGDLNLEEVLRCPDCFQDQANKVRIDVDSLIEAIDEQINAPRERLDEVFQRNVYLTRLYSTMSPHEMTIDPSFGYNRDLGDHDNQRVATRRVRCLMGQPDFANAIIETPSGLRYRERGGENPNVIRRQAGETVRGIDIPGAQIIEEPMPAGQPEVIEDKTMEIEAIAGINNDGGCACDATGDSSSASLLLLSLLVLPLIRHRRRAA